jgi:GTPase SAR1 family protein
MRFYQNYLKVLRLILQQYTVEIHGVICSILADPIIWSIFELVREAIHVPDGTYEVFRRIGDFPPGVKMGHEDCLLARRKTTGIVELNIPTHGFTLTFIDTGGQRSERRKWTNILENRFDVLVYTAALSEFNETCYEDDETNRLQESLKCFQEVASHKGVVDKDIILLLTKTDLFEEKLEKFPLEYYFPHYRIGTDPKEFIKGEFEKCDRGPHKGRLYIYMLNLLDIKDVERMIFNNLARYNLIPEPTETYSKDPESWRKKYLLRPKYQVRHPGIRIRLMAKAIDCTFSFE